MVACAYPTREYVQPTIIQNLVGERPTWERRTVRLGCNNAPPGYQGRVFKPSVFKTFRHFQAIKYFQWDPKSLAAHAKSPPHSSRPPKYGWLVACAYPTREYVQPTIIQNLVGERPTWERRTGRLGCNNAPPGYQGRGFRPSVFKAFRHFQDIKYFQWEPKTLAAHVEGPPHSSRPPECDWLVACAYPTREYLQPTII